MKQRITVFLLFGYLLLVPYCFLGTPFVAMGTSVGMNHIMPTEGMTDCGMMGMGCVGQDDTAHTLDHHANMYLTLTGASGFFGYVLLFLVLSAVLLRVFLDGKLHAYYRLRSCFLLRDMWRLRALTRRDFLRWLSLSETSPTFA